jgi:hypothetical protein
MISLCFFVYKYLDGLIFTYFPLFSLSSWKDLVIEERTLYKWEHLEIGTDRHDVSYLKALYPAFD